MDFTTEQSANVYAIGLKLSGLGIKAKFKKVETGPVVTGYFFELDHSVPIAKVIKRAEDFALALSADKVIVQRIGGEIAIFIPNKERKIVDFKEILHWYLHDENVKKMFLPIPLGVDYHGTKSAFDLTEMPHILIAGSTGAGKSVFLASIITSLTYFCSSNYLNMYLVDTKKVDLPLFSEIPHVKQVADELSEFHNMMGFIMLETRKRLSVLQGCGVRKISEYHTMQGGTNGMPYIILIMDEFGDLMELDSAAKKAGQYEDVPTVKQWIKSLVQIGRAAGVHLIAGTQRSSVRVVDGDIKANLPCRIALRLPTQIDSRTILGTGGAENLLGKGDMLIQRPEKDVVERYHGPYVSGNDIAQLIDQYEMLKDKI